MRAVSLLCIRILAPVTDRKGYKIAVLSEYLVTRLILKKLIVAICHPRSGILDWTFDIWHPRIDVRQPTSNIWHPTSEIQTRRFEIRHPISNILDWTYSFFLRSILAARAGDVLLLELSASFSQDPPLKLQKGQNYTQQKWIRMLRWVPWSLRFVCYFREFGVWERMALVQPIQERAREKRPSILSTTKSSTHGYQAIDNMTTGSCCACEG